MKRRMQIAQENTADETPATPQPATPQPATPNPQGTPNQNRVPGKLTAASKGSNGMMGGKMQPSTPNNHFSPQPNPGFDYGQGGVSGPPMGAVRAANEVVKIAQNTAQPVHNKPGQMPPSVSRVTYINTVYFPKVGLATVANPIFVNIRLLLLRQMFVIVGSRKFAIGDRPVMLLYLSDVHIVVYMARLVLVPFLEMNCRMAHIVAYSILNHL